MFLFVYHQAVPDADPNVSDPVKDFFDLSQFKGIPMKCLEKRIHSRCWHGMMKDLSATHDKKTARELAAAHAKKHLQRWRDHVKKQ